MIVAGTDLASELRRRRLCRPELRECLSRTSASAWVPGAHLNEAPSELRGFVILASGNDGVARVIDLHLEALRISPGVDS